MSIEMDVRRMVDGATGVIPAPRPGELDAPGYVSPEQRRRAVRAVAAAATDARDCAELLLALGLDPHEGRTDG